MFDRKTTEYLTELIQELQSSTHEWVAIDTETTGLHLKADKPFLLTLTFDDKSRAIDLNKIYGPAILQLVFYELKKFKWEIIITTIY